MPRELHEILEGQNVASLSATALQHEPSVLGLHAAEESVRLGSASVVRLESTFHRPPRGPLGEPSRLSAMRSRLKPEDRFQTFRGVIE